MITYSHPYPLIFQIEKGVITEVGPYEEVFWLYATVTFFSDMAVPVLEKHMVSGKIIMHIKESRIRLSSVPHNHM